MPVFAKKKGWIILVGLLWLACIPLMESVAQNNQQEVYMTVLQGNLSKNDTAALTLDEALTIAEAENQTHKVAVAEIKEAKFRYLQRLAFFLPDFAISQPFVNLEGSVQSVSTGDFLRANLTSYQPQLLFRFVILPQGAQFLATKVARKEWDASRQNEQAVLQDVLRQTGVIYYELQRRLQGIAIAQQQIADTQANVVMNQKRFSGGVGTQLDVLQSQTQLIDAENQYVEAVQAAETVALRLNEILNLPAFSEVVPTQTQPQVRMLVPLNANFKVLLARALEQHPRIRTLNKRIESLTQLFSPVSMVEALLVPEVFLQYRTGRLGPSFKFNEMARFDERSYSVGFTYTNLRVSAAMRYMGYRAEIARLRALKGAEQNALGRELGAAWVTSKVKQVQVEIARQRLAVAEETLRASLEQLESAQARNIDVLAAQSNLNVARQNLNATVTEYNQAQVELVYGLGLASVTTLTKGVPLP